MDKLIVPDTSKEDKYGNLKGYALGSFASAQLNHDLVT